MPGETATTRSHRTRRDIVDAAIDVWSVDNTATLARIAQRAGIGRTTVHRHFGDRRALVCAVDDECRRRFDDAAMRADIRSGTGAEALDRLLREVVRLDAVLGLLFADNALVDLDAWQSSGHADPFETVIVRGRSDRTLTTALPADWLVVQCWAALFGAFLADRSGVPLRGRAGEFLVRTVLGGASVESG